MADDEFKLDDDENAPTLELENDAGADESATINLDEETEEEQTEELNLDDGEENGEDAEGEDAAEEEPAEEETPFVAPVSEGSSIGAFTGMLIISFLMYAAAAAVVVYEVSEYAAPGAFPWNAPMP